MVCGAMQRTYDARRTQHSFLHNGRGKQHSQDSRKDILEKDNEIQRGSRATGNLQEASYAG